MNVKIRERHWESLSILLQHFLFQFVEILFVFMCMGLRQALSLNLELIDSASLTSQEPQAAPSVSAFTALGLQVHGNMPGFVLAGV